MQRASKRAPLHAPNLFEYPPEVADSGSYITGFEAFAVDGTIGTVEAATYDHGRSCLVVDTRLWTGGERRLLPAGIVRGVSRDTHRLFLGLTIDEVRDAPCYDEERYRTDEHSYLGAVARYYEPWAPLRDQPRTSRSAPEPVLTDRAQGPQNVARGLVG